LLVAAILSGACAGPERTPADAQAGVTRADARRIHSGRGYQFRNLTLSPEGRASLAARYGQENLPPEEGVRFVHIPNWRTRRHADVFQVGGGSYSLIVCTHLDRIAEVYQKPSGSGQAAIPVEFLSQFVGRSLTDSFEVAASCDEAFTFPRRLRPIEGNVELSKAIARELRKVLIWAEVAAHPHV